MVIGSCKWKDKQYHGKIKGQEDKQWSTKLFTNDSATRTLLKSGGELGCFISGSRHRKNPMIYHERR